MKEFFDYVRKGELRISICGSCYKKVWPPSQYCTSCLSKTKLKKLKGRGILLEFTTSYIENLQEVLGIVDMSGIRVLGSISGQSLYHGIEVKLTKCGISPNGTVFYHFKSL